MPIKRHGPVRAPAQPHARCGASGCGGTRKRVVARSPVRHRAPGVAPALEAGAPDRPCEVPAIVRPVAAADAIRRAPSAGGVTNLHGMR